MKDWREHLAALHFNVDVEKAAQVLIGPDIRNALQTENHKYMKELSATDIFEDALVDEVQAIARAMDSNVDAKLLGSVAATVDKLDLRQAADDLCWSVLLPAVKQLRQKDDREDLNSDFQNLTCLVENSPDEKKNLVLYSLMDLSLIHI